METPANKVPITLEGTAVTDRATKRAGKEDKSKRKDDKSVDQVMKGLNNLETTEEKLAAMCKKFAEVMEENRKLQVTAKQFEKGLTVVQREKEQLQTDHSKAVLTRSRLESLCRELQRQNKAVKEESLLKVREEEEKRKEVSAKFNATLAEITSLMSSSNEKTNKLRDENLDITKKFKSICEQSSIQQQQVDKMNMQRKLEAELSDAKLMKQKLEFTAEKEILLREKQQLLMDLQESRSRMTDMNTNESALKSQVALYSDRYEEFQNALTRSNEVFGGFKGEMDKMSKKIVKLEKETMSWKNRWEKSHQALLEMATDKQQRDAELALTQRQLTQLQKLCRTLQTERTGLLAQIKGSEKLADTPVEDVTVSLNGLAVPTDVGGGDILIDSPLVLNGSTNANENSIGLEELPMPIKEQESVVEPIQLKPAVLETKQNNKSGNKSNKKSKAETLPKPTSTIQLDSPLKVDKSKSSEQEAKTAEKNNENVQKPVASEKSVEAKQTTILPKATLLVEQPKIEPQLESAVVTEKAKPVEAVLAQTAKDTPVTNADVAKLVETPKSPVIVKPDIKSPKGGNQKVNKKSKPADTKQNNLVASVVEKAISADEVKPIKPIPEVIKATESVVVGGTKGTDSKTTEPAKVENTPSIVQEVGKEAEKPISVLLAENIKSLEASLGKADISLKPKDIALVPEQKKEPPKVEEKKPKENVPKLDQAKEKIIEKKPEVTKIDQPEKQTNVEKPKEIKTDKKKQEQVKAEPPKIIEKEKQAKVEKPKEEPVAKIVAAPSNPKTAKMADKAKSSDAVEEVDVQLKENKKVEAAVVVDKAKSVAQKDKSPPSQSKVKVEPASVDPKPSSSTSLPAAKPKTPVENTINAILKVLEASIKQKQLPKEPVTEPAKEIPNLPSKEPSEKTPKSPVKESVQNGAKEPKNELPSSPAKGPVKENPNSLPKEPQAPSKTPLKETSATSANVAPKSPAKSPPKEAPKSPEKGPTKETPKSPVKKDTKISSKESTKGTPTKTEAKESQKILPKEQAKNLAKESAKPAIPKGGPAPVAVGDSKPQEKQPSDVKSAHDAEGPAIAAMISEVASILPLGTSDGKEPQAKPAELVSTPLAPAVAPVVAPAVTPAVAQPVAPAVAQSASNDKAATTTETTETKKVKEGGKKRKK